VKKTFVLLLVIAALVWGYVVFQFLGAYFGRGAAESPASKFETMPAAALEARFRAPLDTSWRDPFQPYLYAQKPAPVIPKSVATPPARPVLQVIEPPTAALGGILWGDPPVAILKEGAATELVKEGAEVFGLKVIKIERHQVTVTKQGRKFVLGY
jgi:hypothetical protein